MNQPWIEKYRPQHLDDIVLDETNRTLIQNMIRKDKYPNMLFYGPPGTGKTTTIMCLMKEYQSIHKCTQNYIHLNASHERGIDVIRNQIHQFTNNSTFFEKHHKFVLLDEMDSLTNQAQKHLYNVIKDSRKKDVTFILICNYLNKVIPTIQKCLFTLHFNKTSLWCDSFIQNCLTKENKHIDQKYINDIKSQYTHDLRSILNTLQNFHKKDVPLCPSLFERLLRDKNYVSKYTKLVSIYDPQTIYCSFFLYLYNKYELNDTIIQTMKAILFQERNTTYFVECFLPMIRDHLTSLNV
tara:strand:+ start:1357 stop:2244 length:888 start_codon:yes stop_codon:yes gene_type:complete